MTTWPSSPAASSSPPDFTAHALSRPPRKKPERFSQPGRQAEHDQQKLRNTSDPSCFAVFWRCRWSVGRGDTPVTRGSWILDGEEDSIDRSFTVLVKVIRRCLPDPPPRARWPVCWPSSARAPPHPHSTPSSD